ncbi:MAG: TSUP family transporter [Chromatiaceae bacterium]|nr:TSUP family transporter [Chromatiaceae bacterium]
MPELDALLWLIPVALIAGCLDAIAGGGGLLTIPALLWSGLGPVEALATNKAQAVVGSATASARFFRQGAIRPRAALPAMLWTCVGAAAGALLVQRLDPSALERLLPFLLAGFALYLWRSPRLGDLDAHERLSAPLFALGVGLGVGFYDGFFGPGTGSFFALAHVALLGYNLRRATAHSKLLNFTSNATALLFFLPSGQIAWGLAAGMALGQLVGAWIGAHLVLRHGAALVRPLLVAVSLLTSASLAWSQWQGG